MAEISAKEVMELRKKTGCGMMECKKALVEANGDFDEAVKVLRERGLAVASKKEDRIAADGVIDILKNESGSLTAMIEVNAETDFVAKNAAFKEFVKGILETILASKPATVADLLAINFIEKDTTVEAEVKNMIFTIGENISIRRFALIEGVTGMYIHGGGSAGVVTHFNTDVADKPEFAEYAKNICMQIAAMGPLYVASKDVPASVIENEKEILMTQIKNDPKHAGKNDSIIQKMVDGRIAKYYETNCLLEQAYVKEDDSKVSKYTADTAAAFGGKIEIVSFVKYEKGEGLAKREEDFAAEIEKLVGGK